MRRGFAPMSIPSPPQAGRSGLARHRGSASSPQAVPGQEGRVVLPGAPARFMDVGGAADGADTLVDIGVKGSFEETRRGGLGGSGVEAHSRSRVVICRLGVEGSAGKPRCPYQVSNSDRGKRHRRVNYLTASPISVYQGRQGSAARRRPVASDQRPVTAGRMLSVTPLPSLPEAGKPASCERPEDSGVPATSHPSASSGSTLRSDRSEHLHIGFFLSPENFAKCVSLLPLCHIFMVRHAHHKWFVGAANAA